MALGVEDGTGANATANAYISVADADAYFTDRANAAWAAATATAKSAAIIDATDYLEAAYNWRGNRLSDVQPLSFPRDIGALPAVLVKANAELAVQALAGPLMPSETGSKLTSESVSVAGAITESRSYASGGGSANERRFPFVDRMLTPLTTGSSGVRFHRIERA